MGRSVEIVFARHLEAERAAARLDRLAQHDRVVIALLDGPQIERVRRLVADQVAQAIDIKGAGAAKVAHAELDMARAHDVERGIGDRRANGHGVLWRFLAPYCTNGEP